MNNTHVSEPASPREQWVDVTVTADPHDSLIRLIQADGEVHEFLSDDAAAVLAAAAHSRGHAQWCAMYHRLLVPGASLVTGGVSFYKLEPKPVALSA